MRSQQAHALPPSRPVRARHQMFAALLGKSCWRHSGQRAGGRHASRTQRTHSCRNWHIPQRALGPLPSSPSAICSKKTLWNKNAALIALSTEQLLQRRGETGGGGAPAKKEIPLSSRASESEGKNVLAQQRLEKHWANMEMCMQCNTNSLLYRVRIACFSLCFSQLTLIQLLFFTTGIKRRRWRTKHLHPSTWRREKPRNETVKWFYTALLTLLQPTESKTKLNNMLYKFCTAETQMMWISSLLQQTGYLLLFVFLYALRNQTQLQVHVQERAHFLSFL